MARAMPASTTTPASSSEHTMSGAEGSSVRRASGPNGSPTVRDTAQVATIRAFSTSALRHTHGRGRATTTTAKAIWAAPTRTKNQPWAQSSLRWCGA